MRLWTLQCEDWLRTLRNDGCISGRLLVGDDADWFLGSYDWMRSKMAQRIPGYGGRYPVWAWAKKPDMRTRSACYPAGKPIYRLTIEVPDELVLLSDFDGFHCVLNSAYLGEPGCDISVYDLDWSPDEIVKSWDRIFDVDAIAQHCERNPEEAGTLTIQAVFEELRLEQVRRVERFVGRMSKRTHFGS